MRGTAGARKAETRDYVGIANAYAREAAADTKGKRFCKWARLAAKRHLEDLKRARAGWDFEFDPWHAADVCDFIEKLPHVDGVWDTPNIHLESVQVFILAVIFGWRRRDDGGRRFTYVYIEVARKFGKSTLTAGVALYCLCCENEPGPQIIVGATTGEQAGKVFKPAKAMVERLPELREAFGVAAWARSITCGDNGGYIQPINAKGKTQDGWNPHMGILDELHAHKDRALFDVIKSAFGARKNPLLWIITTAGFDTMGVCYEQRTYVTKILERVFEGEHVFAIIFTLDAEEADEDGRVTRKADDPFDEASWVKANPMIGITPTLKWFRGEAADAKASPSSEGNFKTKNLNVWLNAAGAWLNMAQWQACADPDLDWDAFDGLECCIGADLADKDDITALALAAIDAEGRLLLKPLFYLPEAVLKHPDHAEGKGPAPYRTWHQQGHLILSEGDWVDHNVIEAQIREWIARFSIRKVTFDQFAAGQAMASRLNENPDAPVAQILHKSAANVTDPAKDLEARVKAGAHKLRHDGNPVLAWMASNTVVSRRVDGSIIPKKETPMSANKIDGIDAAVNAIAPMVAPPQEEAPPRSYLESGDLVFL